MRPIDPLELGGTLFTPITKAGLADILKRKKYLHLRSILIDLEDGLGEQNYQRGLHTLQKLLLTFIPNDLLLFIRPKDADSLQTILGFEHIDKIDGFILPKFSLHNATHYLQPFYKTPFHIMPCIEGVELFNIASLQELRSRLEPLKHIILSIRIGCEDMFRQLRLSRTRHSSIFDTAVGASVMSDVIKTFKPYGYNLSGCVYPFFQDTEGFINDCKRDMKEGLWSKTIIHPNQIQPLNKLYKVSKEEYKEAKRLLESEEAVFAQRGKMVEKTTQTPYAGTIILRKKLYGFSDSNNFINTIFFDNLSFL